MLLGNVHCIQIFYEFFFIRKIMKQEKHVKCIYSAFLFFVCKSVGLKDLRFTKPAYTQKNKSFDSEKSPNLHILKKIKKNKKNNSSMPVSPT